MFTATITSANTLKEEAVYVSKALPPKGSVGPDCQKRIILHTERGVLHLTGSDLEYRQATRGVILHKQEGELHVAVKPDDLLAALKGWQPTYKSLAIEHNGVLKLDGAVVPCEEPAAALLGESEEVLFTIPQDDLRDAFQAIAISLSPDETRPVLTGALMRYSAGGVTLVSSDTYRLTTYRVDSARGGIIDDLETPKQVIIPGGLIRLYLDQKPDQRQGCVPVAFCLGEKTITLRSDTVILTARLIDGDFPNVERVIPDDLPQKRTLSARLFREAIEAVAPVAHRDSERVEVVFDSLGQKLIVTARDLAGTVCTNTQLGGAGDGWLQWFNGQWLTQALGLFDVLAGGKGSEVVIESDSPLRPIKLTSGFFPGVHVLMPMEQFGCGKGAKK